MSAYPAQTHLCSNNPPNKFLHVICNLSLFLPVLANQTWSTFGLILAYIAGLTILIVYLIAYFGHMKPVQTIINRWGEPLMKFCYIGIGIYVFFDSGLVNHLIRLF